MYVAQCCSTVLQQGLINTEGTQGSLPKVSTSFVQGVCACTRTHVPRVHRCRNIDTKGVREWHGDDVIQGVGVKYPDHTLFTATEQVLVTQSQAVGSTGLYKYTPQVS